MLRISSGVTPIQTGSALTWYQSPSRVSRTSSPSVADVRVFTLWSPLALFGVNDDGADVGMFAHVMALSVCRIATVDRRRDRAVPGCIAVVLDCGGPLARHGDVVLFASHDVSLRYYRYCSQPCTFVLVCLAI